MPRHKLITPSFTRRAVATATLAGAAIAVPVMMAGTASADSVNWTAIANCESSGDWAANTGNGFYGGLQFSESTWLAYGGGSYAQYANDASEADQIIVAEAVLAGQGIGAWPVCGAYADSGTTYSGTNTSGSTDSSSSSSSSSDNSSSSSSSSDNSGSSSSSSSSSSDNSGSSSSDQGSTSSSTSSTSSSSSSDSSGTYTVVSGDTLSGIAQKEGISDWHTLYNDNLSVVGSNPDLIYPGQVLNLG
ncbi:LysM peptidoglycan-binding domain-containing protein [Actinospica durhamensis]|uniref:LysM peptidoglycan-binding domain-containing protein n=1 Tax=Actinospica durhamensis TaxID=1508375 RepID=A0A941ESJ3_9ACTN|nr:transglycosylase family protein [Actinospica durhamensis]MBR7836256.1 LysM peptidoglycan-binding domain-containing protein [Actinospica durhamensis]